MTNIEKMFRSEVRAKTLLIHRSNPKMTRRASWTHNNSGFVQSRIERDKISYRMYDSKTGRALLG